MHDLGLALANSVREEMRYLIFRCFGKPHHNSWHLGLEALEKADRGCVLEKNSDTGQQTLASDQECKERQIKMLTGIATATLLPQIHLYLPLHAPKHLPLFLFPKGVSICVLAPFWFFLFFSVSETVWECFEGSE